MRILVFLIIIVFSFLFINAIKEKPELTVVLSFDYERHPDGQNVDLETVFELLERHNATATFFVTGKKAEANPGAVREIYKRDHSLGLHTYYHNFPIFDVDDAALIGRVYKESPEHIWNRSFKTKEAFYEDIIRNRAVVMEAIENATAPAMFRCPSLIVNWTSDPAYFETLKMAGIEIDSSIQQDLDNPRPFYVEHGVVEVPAVASEKRLDDFPMALRLARRCAKAGVPLVLYLHPQNMDESRVKALDRYLDILELKYDVVYLKIEEVPGHYTS